MAKNFSKVKDEFTIGYNSNFFDEQIYLCLYGIIRTPFQKSKKVIYNDTKDTHIGIALGLFNNIHKLPTTRSPGTPGSAKPPSVTLKTKNILEDITFECVDDTSNPILFISDIMNTVSVRELEKNDIIKSIKIGEKVIITQEHFLAPQGEYLHDFLSDNSIISSNDTIINIMFHYDPYLSYHELIHEYDNVDDETISNTYDNPNDFFKLYDETNPDASVKPNKNNLFVIEYIVPLQKELEDPDKWSLIPDYGLMPNYLIGNDTTPDHLNIYKHFYENAHICKITEAGAASKEIAFSYQYIMKKIGQETDGKDKEVILEYQRESSV